MVNFLIIILSRDFGISSCPDTSGSFSHSVFSFRLPRYPSINSRRRNFVTDKITPFGRTQDGAVSLAIAPNYGCIHDKADRVATLRGDVSRAASFIFSLLVPRLRDLIFSYKSNIFIFPVAKSVSWIFDFVKNPA
jgi:hypothetical protein